jgi:putative transcriptional regulator
MLLLASPELLDPNFAESVVLLLDADEDGAMGVVINRPSPVPVISVLAEWGDIVAEPEVLFRGGPVSPEGAPSRWPSCASGTPYPRGCDR